MPSEPGAGGAIVYKILTGLEANPSPLQFIYSEKAAKFEKIFVVLLIRASCSVRATETCQKVDEDFSKQMWSSRNIQILPFYFYQVI